MSDDRIGKAQVRAAVPTKSGWLHLSGGLSPYDVEHLYEQILTVGRPTYGDVRLDVRLGEAGSDGPEMRALTHHVQRLERRGLRIRVTRTAN